jgi:two-component system phosphate regulon response regulator PhoB
MSRTRKVLIVGSCGKLAGRLPVLRGGAVEVRSAETAAGALERHRADRADLIVTDLDLADSTAERLCEALRSHEALRNVSILVACGPAESEKRRAEACRANGQVVRPFGAEELAARIKGLMAVSSRAHYRVLTQVTTGDPSHERSFFCTSQNVSPAGMLIEASEPLRVGQALDCSFFLPGRLKLVAKARVVREASAPEGRHFGIQFVQLSRQDSDALARFVDHWGTLR